MIRALARIFKLVGGDLDKWYRETKRPVARSLGVMGGAATFGYQAEHPDFIKLRYTREGVTPFARGGIGVFGGGGGAGVSWAWAGAATAANRWAAATSVRVRHHEGRGRAARPGVESRRRTLASPPTRAARPGAATEAAFSAKPAGGWGFSFGSRSRLEGRERAGLWRTYQLGELRAGAPAPGWARGARR